MGRIKIKISYILAIAFGLLMLGACSNLPFFGNQLPEAPERIDYGVLRSGTKVEKSESTEDTTHSGKIEPSQDEVIYQEQDQGALARQMQVSTAESLPEQMAKEEVNPTAQAPKYVSEVPLLSPRSAVVPPSAKSDAASQTSSGQTNSSVENPVLNTLDTRLIMAAPGHVVAIRALSGAPRGASDYIVSALAGSSGGFISKHLAANASNFYLLRGHVITAAESDQTGVVIQWDLLDQTNSRATAFDVTVGQPQLPRAGETIWNAITAKSLDTLALKTADKLFSILQLSTNPTVANSSKPSLVDDRRVYPPAIAKVALGKFYGAPGDGNSALKKAISRSLQSHGAVIVDDANADAILEVSVSRTHLASADRIAIVWTVFSGGSAIGQIAQENDVETNSLEVIWGDTAAKAANAATPDIIEVLREVGRSS